MSVDLVSVSLTVHGAILAASVVAMWKLGGESKFGTEKLSDLHLLRPKVLKATVSALELALNPVLTANGTTESIEFDEDDNPMPKPARFNVYGKEALTNAVRDFVQVRSPALVDLCHLNKLDNLLTGSMQRLRIVVFALVATTVFMCGLMMTAKFGWTEMANPGVHVAVFSAVSALVVAAVVTCGLILYASSRVDQLKGRYVDLPN